MAEKAPLNHRVKELVRELFAVDLRSLAALRIALAMIVLIDLASRVSDLRVHYSDAGVLPRDLAIDNLSPWRWSLFFIAGSDVFSAALFGVTILAAVGMLLGYRTRVMIVVVWVMVVSLQTRNPMALSAADTYLRLLLFWSMFLPLGAWWSLDRRRLRYPVYRSMRFTSMATAALFAQIAFMYLFTAILKSGETWRSDGTALYYAFGAQHLTRDLGEFLFPFEGLLQVLTFVSLGMEFLIPLLLFLPVWTAPARLIAVAMTVTLHLGIFSTMDLGLFPLTSALSMTCFLPTMFWERVVPSLHATAQHSAPLRRTTQAIGSAGSTLGMPLLAWASADRSHRMLDGPDDSRREHRPTVSGGAHEPEVALRTSVLTNAFVALCLLLVLAWNVATVSPFNMPESARPTAQALGLYQQWNMFAPNPVRSTVWYVYMGTLADGTELDLLPATVQGHLGVIRSVSWDMPADISGDLYGSKYWRKYLDAIAQDDNRDQRRTLAGYICRSWNGHYAENIALTGLEMYRVSRLTLPHGERGPVRQHLISDYTCN